MRKHVVVATHRLPRNVGPLLPGFAVLSFFFSGLPCTLPSDAHNAAIINLGSSNRPPLRRTRMFCPNSQTRGLKRGIFHLVFCTPKKSHVFCYFGPNGCPGGLLQT